eukprot:5704463-Pyramimonas_sp.AAC.1
MYGIELAFIAGLCRMSATALPRNADGKMPSHLAPVRRVCRRLASPALSSTGMRRVLSRLCSAT